jgi:hypothetical protein
MKPFFLALLGALLGATGCTYNVTQQQNGKAGSQLAIVGGSEGPGVTAIQSTGSIRPYPLSTYPEYNGYPGSGRRYYPQGGSYNIYRDGRVYSSDGGPIGPAYPPDYLN